MSIDKIDLYLSELEMIRDYEVMKRKLEEATAETQRIRDKPMAMLHHIIDELRKPKNQRNFTQEEIESGLVDKIDSLITLESQRKADFDSMVSRFRQDIKRALDDPKKS